MSSILEEHTIKSSVQSMDPTMDHLTNDLALNIFIEDKLMAFYKGSLSFHVERINELETEIDRLKEIIDELKLNPASSITSDELTPTELRANCIYTELCKKGKLSSSDVKRICKLKHYSAAYRAMDKVAEMYPDECIMDEGINGNKKKWLALRGYKGY